MAATRTLSLRAPDGGEFAGHLALPERGSGPGMLVLQEIFGVNDYVREACERLARLGYVSMAPDLYWRLGEPGIDIPHDEPGLKRALGYVQQFDVPTAAGDAVAALERLRSLPEVSDDGHAGALGFCLGGTLAYLVAVQGSPDCAVCYYGSGIPDMLDAADRIDCPVIFHYGGSDPYIPREKVAAVEAVAAARPGMQCRVQEDAGHAFDNYDAPMFHQPEPAARAWELTRDFLARTLPVPAAGR